MHNGNCLNDCPAGFIKDEDKYECIAKPVAANSASNPNPSPGTNPSPNPNPNPSPTPSAVVLCPFECTNCDEATPKICKSCFGVNRDLSSNCKLCNGGYSPEQQSLNCLPDPNFGCSSLCTRCSNQKCMECGPSYRDPNTNCAFCFNGFTPVNGSLNCAPLGPQQPIMRAGCHYTCDMCHTEAGSKYEGCLKCAVEGAKPTLPYTNCECSPGFTLNEMSCEQETKGGALSMSIINGITNIVTIGSIMTGLPFALTWKLVDISQLFSLYYFSGSPNFRDN